MITSRTRRPASTARGAKPASLQRLMASRHKQPQDTEAGCRGFAADDLVRAGDMTGALPRARMEHSAAVWTARADLLRRVEAGSLRRFAAANAMAEEA